MWIRSGDGSRCWAFAPPWTLVITVAVWAWFTWPLPRHVGSAIPFTPPFSMLFSGLHRWGGMAIGWNLTGLAALWLGYAFTVGLARRYHPSLWVARVAALPALLLPYRWDALLGGNPTGLNMVWIPALLLGLDVAIRDERARGGWLAGLALCMIGVSGDAVVSVGALLVGPCWCVVAVMARGDAARVGRSINWRLQSAMLPAAALLALSVGLQARATALVGVSSLRAARGVQAAAFFSPPPSGFLAWRTIPPASQIYLGPILILLLSVGVLTAVVLRRTARGVGSQPALLLAVLMLVFGVAMLALGACGPLDGLLYRAACSLPPVRGAVLPPAEFFCVMPPLLTLALAIGLGPWIPFNARRRAVMLAAVAALLVGDASLQYRAGLHRLPSTEPAYAKVVREARAEGLPAALTPILSAEWR